MLYLFSVFLQIYAIIGFYSCGIYSSIARKTLTAFGSLVGRHLTR